MRIKFTETCRTYWKSANTFFREKSGGKTIVNFRTSAPTVIVGGIVIAFLLFFLMPKVDNTYYRQTSQKQDYKETSKQPLVVSAMANLFAAGKKTVESDKKNEATAKKNRVVVKYVAPQIVGERRNGRNSMRQGLRLIGFLKNPIDTRAQTLVRVILPRGGESGGIEIEPGSVLVGNYNYSGDGDRIFVSFSRLDPPEGGEPKKISAAALDAGTFTPGVQGDEFTGHGEKIAVSIGLNMFSGMTDTLTERESLGNSFNGVQAKPSMKNALLQGLSKASQDQVSRATSQIQEQRSYVIVPVGKEMIIELLEDYK